MPLLEAWRDIRKRAADLDRQLLAVARRSQASELLTTIPGIGAVTAVSYIAAIEDPDNFRTSRSVGAWLGLTTRRYQSGEMVRSTITTISREEVTTICRGCFMKRRQCFSRAPLPGPRVASRARDLSCVSGWASSALRWQLPASLRSSCTACSGQEKSSTHQLAPPHKQPPAFFPQRVKPDLRH